MIATRHSFEFELFVSNFLLAEALGLPQPCPCIAAISTPTPASGSGVATLHALGGMFWLIDLFFVRRCSRYRSIHIPRCLARPDRERALHPVRSTAVFQGLANDRGARVALGRHGVPICDERTTGT